MTSTIYDTLGFNDNPFPPGACRDHYFQTETTNRILEVLAYGIKSHKGFLVFIGEVGLGKTSLLLQLLPLLEESNVRTSWVFNTAVDKYELLQTLVQDYGIALPETPHLSTLIDSLHTFFLEEHRAGHNCAIIIDEAHNLDFQCMEALRMLSNLELNGEKLVQILLTGQPELKTKLDQPEMRQLTSRINVFLTLPPLNPDEIAHYVNFKLSAVGSQLYLEEKAHRLLCEVSGGNLRMINLLMEKTMYAMVALGERRVSRRTVYEGVKDVAAWNKTVASSLRRVSFKQFSIYGGIGAASVAIIAGLVFMFLPGGDSFDDAPPLADNSQVTALSAAPAKQADAAAPNGNNAELDPIIEDSPAANHTINQPKANNIPPTEPGESSELLKASADFLAPWGLNYLAGPLRNAVEEKQLDSFILSLPTDKAETKNLRLVPLEDRPPDGKISVSYFPWHQLTGTGAQWLALWQPPIEITHFTRRYKGDEIRELQRRLQDFGFYDKELDGVVGPGTVQALKNFQKSHGLEESGTPDQQTLLWLYLDNADADGGVDADMTTDQLPQDGDADPSTVSPEEASKPFQIVRESTKPAPPRPKSLRSEELNFNAGNPVPPRRQPNTVTIRPQDGSSETSSQMNSQMNSQATSPASSQTKTQEDIKGPGSIPNTNR